MPRHKYKRPPKKPFDIMGFIASVKQITIEKQSIRCVSTMYNIPLSSMSRYMRKLKDENIDPATTSNEKLLEFATSLLAKTGGKTIFNSQQEKDLMQYLSKARKLCDGLTSKQTRKLAYDFARKIEVKYPPQWDENGEASDDWYRGYIHRVRTLEKHAKELETKLPSPKKHGNQLLSMPAHSAQQQDEHEDVHFCTICREAMPKWQNTNNAIRCNECDRAVHLKCADLVSGYYTCVHCEESD